jgi:hypothetical protein
MKLTRILWLLMVLLMNTNWILSQTIYISGTINSDTTWNADTIKIIGDVTVDTGIVLSILPGTYIEAQGYYRIDVHGSILAVGEPSDSIWFTVNDTTDFWQDTTSLAGGWGGINISRDFNAPDTSRFEYCAIQYGKKYDDYAGITKGGAVFVKEYGGLIIKSCTFSNNMVICYVCGIDGAYGGSIYCFKTAYVFIDSCRFFKNRSFDHGGAIHIGNACVSTTISNNLFTNNIAYWFEYIGGGWTIIGGTGAAISLSSNGLYTSIISNNQCFNNKSLGASIYTSTKNALVYNNVICNNWGPGIMDGSQLSHVRYFNNTIVNNQSKNGGIHLISNAHVYNNIVWNNVNYPGQVIDQIYIDQGQHPDLFYNCVQYGDGGDGAVFEYPEFVDPSSGIGLGYDGLLADWSLLDESPCINTGTHDTTGLKIPEFDVLGNPRIYGNRIEIGAFENQFVWTFIDKNPSYHQLCTIYPNPGSDYCISIVGAQHPLASVAFYDVGGKQVLHQTLFQSQTRINTTSLQTGTHIYRFYAKGQLIGSGKWIKQ